MNESSLVLRAYTTVGSKNLVESLYWLGSTFILGSPDIPPVVTVKPGQVGL